MIVANNRFNTPQRLQNKRQNDTNFGKLSLPKIPAKIPVGNNGVYIKTKGAAQIAGVIALLAGMNLYIFLAEKKDKQLHQDVAIATKADSTDVFYKSSLLKEDSTDYLEQVLDSAYGGKSTPNKTFKTDSLVRREAAIFRAQSDSIAQGAINELHHADQLRKFSEELLKTK